MSIIKQYHRDTDTTYVYSSEYYYDKDKKQSRSKRKLIGKIDEETGEIVATGKRGRKKKNPEADNESTAQAGEKSKVAKSDKSQEGDSSAKAKGISDADFRKLMKQVEEQENTNVQLRVQMNSMEEGYKKLLTEKDDTIKNLQLRVRDLEGAIGRARQSLDKAMGSLGDA